MGLCGIGVSKTTAEIFCRVNDAILEMGGDFDLMTAAKIQAEVEQKYKSIHPTISVGELEALYNSVLPQKERIPTSQLLDELQKIIETNKEIPI